MPKSKLPKLSDAQLEAAFKWSAAAEEDNELAKLYLEACGLIGRVTSTDINVTLQKYWPDNGGKMAAMGYIKAAMDINKTRLEYRDRIARIIVAHLKSEKKKASNVSS